jgi:phenylacetic acid degradation operon negative regulatory protein
MNTAEAALETLIARLHERGRLRVWSLVITVFGDAIVPRGGKVPLSVLQEIMGRLRVEPGALRTALSRLAADQWVTREKDGRNSLYALDAHGRRAFDLATRRIYASGPPEWDGMWTVALAPPDGRKAEDRDTRFRAAGFAAAGGAYLRPETPFSPDADAILQEVLVVRGVHVDPPPAIARFWRLDETAAAYRGFHALKTPLCVALESGEPLRPLDAMAARTLLIHDWRRIVLHDPELPPALLPTDWPGEGARALTRRIYGHLRSLSETWLDEAGLPLLVDPAGFARRFGKAAAQRKS